MHYDIEMIKRDGYKVAQKSPWHYQVTNGRKIMNVWPTARKYMIEYGGGASLYSNAQELIEIFHGVIGHPGKRTKDPLWLVKKIRAEFEATRTDEERAAEKQWRKDVTALMTEISTSV